MNTNKFTSPQILSGIVSLNSGQSQTVTMETMASRSHRWLRLDELSVALYPTPGTNVQRDFNTTSPMGSIVNIRSRAYRQDLMLNYVPVWLLGPRLHLAAEYSGANTSIPNYGPFETYRWKFSKPFFLPPGSAFVTQLQRNGLARDRDMGGTINAQVVVRGAQLSEGEARAAMLQGQEGSGNPIPYIAAYAPDFSATSYFMNKSNNLDLANPFLVPLKLQRMTGRVSHNNNVLTPGPPYGTGFGCQVKLADTRVVICEWADMMKIFPATQLAWTHTRVLQPAEYITAELKNTSDGSYAPQVAIVGYRNEVLP